MLELVTKLPVKEVFTFRSSANDNIKNALRPISKGPYVHHYDVLCTENDASSNVASCTNTAYPTHRSDSSSPGQRLESINTGLCASSEIEPHVRELGDCGAASMEPLRYPRDLHDPRSASQVLASAADRMEDLVVELSQSSSVTPYSRRVLQSRRERCRQASNDVYAADGDIDYDEYMKEAEAVFVGFAYKAFIMRNLARRVTQTEKYEVARISCIFKCILHLHGQNVEGEGQRW